MQQATLIAIIEDVAPPAFAAPWDRSGIQAASTRADIRHLAVSLDPTPNTVRRAVAAGADMLLTHHPLTLEPRFPDRPDAYREVLGLLFAHDMPLYAAHTSLDASREGPAAWLPDELGLTGRVPLERTGSFVREGREQVGGIGCAGDLPAPLSFPELTARLAALLPMDRTCATARLIGTAPSVVRRIAVCTGSGASLLDSVRQTGSDLFITGDMKYHAALDLLAENALAEERGAAPLAVLDVGHFSLEEEMTRRLARLLEERLDGVTVSFLPGRDPFSPCPLTTDVPEVLP